MTEVQEQTNWCWAACARMAAGTFNLGAPKQCEIVTSHLPGAVACCINGATAQCNQALDELRIPALYTALKMSAEPLGSDTVDVTESAVRSALTGGPVLALLDLGTFHFVLVQGMTGAIYHVADPKYANVVDVPWSQLETAYGNGSLAQAWKVRRAQPRPGGRAGSRGTPR
ncbi:MAG TPA: papain-like cysteine protease family protein [Candidatus Elarobacter sp.]|nr:papain-like cysteine protease family protein [Candidatus Elarobacter sp.]